MYRYAVNLMLLFFLLSPLTALAGKDDWKPVDPAHLALKAPLVEKDADAEAIFWEVYVKDEIDGQLPRTVLTHYLRIKIFTERGRDSQTKIDIPYLGKYQIKDIAGRTIKPDGTIVELKKDAIFERTIINVRGRKLKAKSFAMPAVEPGAIIEYRWREIRDDTLSLHVHLDFQRDIPVQLIKYYIKPLSLPNLPFGMRAKTFNGNSTPFVREDGYSLTTMRNVPAYHEEPQMPPEDTVRPWMLIFYEEDKPLTPEQYWQDFGKKFYEKTRNIIKPNDDIKKVAATIVGTSREPKEKLEKIFQYCRTQIKNVEFVKATESEKKKAEDNKTAGDLLKNGVGGGFDIDLLFAALANAAGFDARLALLADRGRSFFDRNFTNSYFMEGYQIAVKVGEEWLFFDPGTGYLPYGFLRWQEEGQEALISDPQKSFFTATPLSPPEKTVEKRTARLRLTEDGTLEGSIHIEYSGHFDIEKKRDNRDDAPNEREETLRQLIKSRLSNAEITSIEIKNVEEMDKPFSYNYYVRVPGYAQKTGKRLFLQPGFFQKGLTALFSTSERKHPIYFHYPWSEEDNISIELPANYLLDSPTIPAPMTIPNIGKYEVKMWISSDKRVLSYHRSFSFGEKGLLFFPNTSYPQLKQVFDLLFERDSHTVTLKQSQPATPTATTETGGGE